jgi:hypothetical protein
MKAYKICETAKFPDRTSSSSFGAEIFVVGTFFAWEKIL